MSSKTGQAICAGINRPITHPPDRARSNTIAHSGRYVALNPAEIECFMSLQLDNDRYEYTIRFIELAIQCRQLEGMDHTDVCGLRNDVIFYEAMFHLFSETGVSLDIENYCTIRASPACQRRCLWFLSALQ